MPVKNIVGNLTVSGATTLSGNLTVSGTASFNNILIGGDTLSIISGSNPLLALSSQRSIYIGTESSETKVNLIANGNSGAIDLSAAGEGGYIILTASSGEGYVSIYSGQPAEIYGGLILDGGLTVSGTTTVNGYSVGPKYEHNIYLYGTSSDPFRITLKLINNSSTAITTVANLRTAVYNAGFTSNTILLSASGSYKSSSECDIAVGVYANSSTLYCVYDKIASLSSTTMTMNTTYEITNKSITTATVQDKVITI